MSYENGEMNNEKPPVYVLFSDLHHCKDYVTIHMAFQRYVYQEFILPGYEDGAWSLDQLDSFADDFVGDLLEKGVLPSREEFERDEEGGKEQFRRAFYDVIIPAYEETHTREEIDDWLPRAYDVVLPKENRHELDSCRVTLNKDDVNCQYGFCLQKYVARDIKSSLLRPDFESFEYQLDSEKKCIDTLRRLAYATDVLGGEPAMYAQALEGHYLTHYSSYFESLP